MPKNTRPGTFFGDWDPQWAGSTRTERKLAQNQYDILEQLEQLNQRVDNKSTTNASSIPTNMDWVVRSLEDLKKDCENIGLDYEITKKYFDKYNSTILKELDENVGNKKYKDYVDKQNSYDNVSNKVGSHIESIARGTLGIMMIVCVIIFAYMSKVVDWSNIFSALLQIGAVCGLALLGWVFLIGLYANARQEIFKKQYDTKSQQYISPTYTKLYNFKLSHFDNRINTLIYNFTVPKIRQYYSNPYNIEEFITGYGTAEDYNNFFKNNL